MALKSPYFHLHTSRSRDRVNHWNIATQIEWITALGIWEEITTEKGIESQEPPKENFREKDRPIIIPTP